MQSGYPAIRRHQPEVGTILQAQKGKKVLQRFSPGRPRRERRRRHRFSSIQQPSPKALSFIADVEGNYFVIRGRRVFSFVCSASSHFIFFFCGKTEIFVFAGDTNKITDEEETIFGVTSVESSGGDSCAKIQTGC